MQKCLHCPTERHVKNGKVTDNELKSSKRKTVTYMYFSSEIKIKSRLQTQIIIALATLYPILHYLKEQKQKPPSILVFHL